MYMVKEKSEYYRKEPDIRLFGRGGAFAHSYKIKFLNINDERFDDYTYEFLWIFNNKFMYLFPHILIILYTSLSYCNQSINEIEVG